MNESLYGVLLFHRNGSTVFQSCRWDDYETADRMLWHTVMDRNSEYTGGDILRWDGADLEPVVTR